MMPDLTAGVRGFRWKQRKEVGRREDMNVETSVPLIPLEHGFL